MTRDKAREELLRHRWEIAETIDKIYNDFESRTCESCKHNKFKKTTVKDDGFFECDLLYMESSSWWTTDFGCNKYEPNV